MADWLIESLAWLLFGLFDGWPACWLAGTSADLLAFWLAGLLDIMLVGWLFGLSTGWMIGLQAI